VKWGFSWRTPLCGGLKILLDWAEKGSVLVVAPLAVSPCYEGFSILQKLGIPAYHARLGERSSRVLGSEGKLLDAGTAAFSLHYADADCALPL
jgi:hypothetical protein